LGRQNSVQYSEALRRSLCQERGFADTHWSLLEAALESLQARSRLIERYYRLARAYPGAELRHVKGFKSKAEIDEWLQGSGRVAWLRSQGYAK
jgi:hypothetical protein